MDNFKRIGMSDSVDIKHEELTSKRRKPFESFVSNDVVGRSIMSCALEKNKSFICSCKKDYSLVKPSQITLRVPKPRFGGLKIGMQMFPYDRSNVLLLTIPNQALKSEQVDAHIRQSYKISYGIFLSMGPCMSIKPSLKSLCCKGSFTYDFSTCKFEAKILRLDPAISQEHRGFIYEFSRMSLGGKIAFSQLVQSMGVSLKRAGCVERYGNGCKIFASGINEHDVFPSMPSLPIVELRQKSWRVHLEPSEVNRLVDSLMLGGYKSRKENLRFLAKLSAESLDNREALKGNTNLLKAVVYELKFVSDPQNYYNALKLIEYGVVSPQNSAISVGRSLQVYSENCAGGKDIFSSAIANAAIAAIHKLVCTMPKVQREKVLSTLEKGLQGIVNEKVIQAVGDMHKTSGNEVSNIKTQLSVYV